MRNALRGPSASRQEAVVDEGDGRGGGGDGVHRGVAQLRQVLVRALDALLQPFIACGIGCAGRLRPEGVDQGLQLRVGRAPGHHHAILPAEVLELEGLDRRDGLVAAVAVHGQQLGGSAHRGRHAVQRRLHRRHVGGAVHLLAADGADQRKRRRRVAADRAGQATLAGVHACQHEEPPCRNCREAMHRC
ncbi:hypothetical protein [Aquabacterium humicola]|uniref:hypothetical protein n=1 Tax=Aquabacterium humicola TaxID=3237377 RepID=UPI0025431879|nr:hypothetical protein [Rubrivivax pictus]